MRLRDTAARQHSSAHRSVRLADQFVQREDLRPRLVLVRRGRLRQHPVDRAMGVDDRTALEAYSLRASSPQGRLTSFNVLLAHPLKIENC